MEVDVKDEGLLGFSSQYEPLPLKFKGLTMKNRKTGVKHLDNVTGEFPPGIIAVMGPSGGGKTTFITGLTGRATYADVTGQVELGDVSDGIGKFPTEIGFSSCSIF